MKKLAVHTVFSLGMLLIGSVSVGAAQQQKVGYVDTDFILSKMPEYQGIQQQLRSVSEQWNTELKKMAQQVKQLKKDFQSKEILYTDELRDKKQQEIENDEQQRKQFFEEKFGAEGQYFQRQKELLEPIQRKVLNAINVIAERGGYDFVFDRAQNTTLLYGDQQWNLNNQILQELDITLNDSNNR